MHISTLVICPPGPLSNWIFRILGISASRFGLYLNYVDRNDVIPDDTPALIYICQLPNPSAIRLIRAGRLNPVFIDMDLRWGIAALLASGHSFLEAVRLFSAAMVANRAIGATSCSRIVFPVLDQPSSLTARNVFAHAGLPADPVSVSDVLEIASGPDAKDTPLAQVVLSAEPHLQLSPLSQQQSAIVDKALTGLVALSQGDAGKPIIWPTDVFFNGDEPDTPVPVVVPLVGPSRIIAYGPYLHLPPGTYDGELIIALAGLIDSIPLLLEIQAEQELLASFRLLGRKSGGYRARFQVTIVDPQPAIEVRLRNERGAIEGEVSLVEVRFYALRDTSPL